MVSRILFWTGFGIITRAWQLGIQMRPIFSMDLGGLLAWPIYGGAGASFGYWLKGVDERQSKVLKERKEALMEKRARRLAAQTEEGSGAASA